MKTTLCLFFLMAGCTRYVQVESDLVDQARKGIQLTSTSLSDRAKTVDDYHALQRKILDDAFDQDVRERTNLSADWIIDARRAYAAGIDALNAQKQASTDASAADQRNLDAIDKTLIELKSLQSIEGKFLSIPTTQP